MDEPTATPDAEPEPRDEARDPPAPTPSEIAAACERIRRGWSEEEAARRRSGPVAESMPGRRRPPASGWTPPEVSA